MSVNFVDFEELMTPGKHCGAACNFLGFIVLLTGPHAGTDTDTKIWQRWVIGELPMEWWEAMVTDGAGQGIEQFWIPFPEDQAPPGSLKALWNVHIQHFRARVEQTFKDIARFAVWRQMWRSHDLLFLERTMHVLCSLENVRLKAERKFAGHPPGYPATHPGWDHFPGAGPF
eukprot:gene15774-biopygen13108